MIVPMKKVSLIVLGDKKEKALRKLRRLGVMQIEISEGKGERLASLRENISLLENSSFTVAQTAKKYASQKDATPAEAIKTAEKIAYLTESKKARLSEALSYRTELDRLRCWGEVDPAALAELKAKGVDLTLYELPASELDRVKESLGVIVLAKTKANARCLILRQGLEGENEAIDTLTSYRTEMPKLSTAALRQRLEDAESRIADIDAQLAACAVYYQAMRDAISATQKDVEFEVYSTGMTSEELSEGARTVVYFSGYIQAEDVQKLREAAKESSWGLVVDEPTEEDNVPTKLKNNKLVSLVYPLTDFLGTVPGYFEYDISAWFLGFILIFFGIIFGDGGYGLLICAAAAALIAKPLISKQKIPPAFLLVGLFGLSTVLWGTLTCTWFGLAPEQLPLWLRSLSVPVISNVYADKIWYPFWTGGEAGLTTAQNLQIFCFTLALIQLTVAHIKCAVRNHKSIKMLGDIGSIFQLFGIYYVVLAFVVNGAVFPLGLVLGGIPVGLTAIALVGVGFVMSFVFSNYEGSIIKSVLSSLKNIVSVLLGVVNVFSDIVSYIRLWAVGLAGAAISATVNELASPMLGSFMLMIIAIVLLVFGHGLNMILNVLSVIVHGIRLNTLEFSSHLDMSWSGHKFKPFEE